MLAMLSAIYIKRQLYLQHFYLFFRWITHTIFTFFVYCKPNTQYTSACGNNMLTSVINIAQVTMLICGCCLMN